jgi:ketosteroid isomerase-like protein
MADDDMKARIDALESRVKRLEDEREILRTFHRFNRAIDYSGDVPAFARAFTEDAVIEVTDTSGMVVSERRGLVEIQAHQAKTDAGRTHPAKHVMFAPLIEVDGDVAQMESYFVAFEDAGDGPYINVYGISTTSFVRTGKEWRMTLRRGRTEAVAPRE